MDLKKVFTFKIFSLIWPEVGTGVFSLHPAWFPIQSERVTKINYLVARHFSPSLALLLLCAEKLSPAQ